MQEKYDFRVPQKALIFYKGKCLAVKRSPTAKVYPNCWDFPGGKMEHGENPTEGLKREVLEETNLQVKVIKPIFVHSEKNLNHAYLIVFECELIGSEEIKLSPEHTEYKWVKKEELLAMETEPYIRELFC
ncbi:MAG: NUDIX domain-containing protein [archaeon]|jgi:8-oxo-dGTP pyrophosphatase MutT (NUDIX family)